MYIKVIAAGHDRNTFPLNPSIYCSYFIKAHCVQSAASKMLYCAKRLDLRYPDGRRIYGDCLINLKAY